VFLIMFNTGHALLLPGGRFLSPRHGRETGAEQPRTIKVAWPHTRHIHESELVQDRTQPRFGQVHKQSVTALRPRPQSRSQTVRVLAQATVSIVRELAAAADVNCPQAVLNREQSTVVNWSRTKFVRERGQAKSGSPRSIAVSAWASANFPVFIQIISPYEHV
jgi:hypothetical protein